MDLKKTEIAPGVFIANSATVLGNVILEENVNIWFQAVVRSENAKIVIGKNSNIQDNCTCHTDTGYDLTLGENVTVGHNAIVHGCTIGNNTLIGMGAICMDGATIGNNCIIGAGTVVLEGRVIPDGSVAVGNPARIIGKTSPEQIEANIENASHYVELAKLYSVKPYTI